MKSASRFGGSNVISHDIATETTLTKIHAELETLNQGGGSTVTIANVDLPVGGQTDDLEVKVNSGTLNVGTCTNVTTVGTVTTITNDVDTVITNVDFTAGDQSYPLTTTENEFVKTEDTIDEDTLGPVIFGQRGSEAHPFPLSFDTGAVSCDLEYASIGNLGISWNKTNTYDIVTGNGTALTPFVPRVCIADDNSPIEVKPPDGGLDIIIKDVDIEKDGPLQTSNLNVNSNRWEINSSSYWSPFMADRFVEFNADDSSDADNVFWIQGKETDWAWARTANKFRLKPNTTIEITFTCKLIFDTTSGDPEDYNWFGLYATTPTGGDTFPKSSIMVGGQADFGTPNAWYMRLYHNNDQGVISTSANFLNVPTDNTPNTYKFVISNYPKTVVYLYQLNQDLDVTWKYITRLQLAHDRLGATEFYLGNIMSTTTATKPSSVLYNFEIKTNAPAFRLYDELPVYRSYFNTAQVRAAVIGTNYAVLGIRMNPDNNVDAAIYIKNIVLVVDDAGDEVILSAYKNPNFTSGSVVWSPKRDRAQFSTLVNTLIINGTTSYPWQSTWCNTTSGVGNRLSILEFPERSLALYDENDAIYISLITVNTANVDCHVTFNYYY